jgi:hypothetical protein
MVMLSGCLCDACCDFQILILEFLEYVDNKKLCVKWPDVEERFKS